MFEDVANDRQCLAAFARVPPRLSRLKETKIKLVDLMWSRFILIFIVIAWCQGCTRWKTEGVDVAVWPLGASSTHMSMNACMNRHNNVKNNYRYYVTWQRRTWIILNVA